MHKSTKEAPNLPVTRSDIFGADDTSDEDEAEHSRETENDWTKRVIKRITRIRLSELGKIELALYSHKKSLLTQKGIIKAFAAWACILQSHWVEAKLDLKNASQADNIQQNIRHHMV